VISTRFLPHRRTRPAAALAVLALALLVGGCGTGSSTSTITVGAENANDSTIAKAEAPSTTATTPTSGELSKEPTVPPQTGNPPTKLVVKDLVAGEGAAAKGGDTVTVNYVGALYKGGKVFDASWRRKEPFTFVLGKHQVIAGWDQGVEGMKVGGRRLLIIPAPLGYGAKGAGTSIPPNSALVFVVDLLGT
jgi:peptidylprolyl isomerase